MLTRTTVKTGPQAFFLLCRSMLFGEELSNYLRCMLHSQRRVWVYSAIYSLRYASSSTLGTCYLRNFLDRFSVGLVALLLFSRLFGGDPAISFSRKDRSSSPMPSPIASSSFHQSLNAIPNDSTSLLAGPISSV